MDVFNVKVNDDKEKRLDAFLSENLEEISRSQIKKLIEDKLVIVNDKAMKSSYRVKKNDLIKVSIPKDKEIEVFAENIDINIIYEDKDIVIVNKAQGMVVHPGVGNLSGTLVNALLYHVESLSTYNKEFRPGIVHRIDKDTSGILLVAKNNEAYKFVANQFKKRQVKRNYLVLVHGRVENDKGKIIASIGRNKTNRMKMAVVKDSSRKAISYYKVIKRFHKYTLLEVSLETGRTHQIRVHMEYLNHPVAGDPTYSSRSNNFGINKQMLHAYKLGFIHPDSKEYVEFKADLPNYFLEIIEKLESNNL